MKRIYSIMSLFLALMLLCLLFVSCGNKTAEKETSAQVTETTQATAVATETTAVAELEEPAWEKVGDLLVQTSSAQDPNFGKNTLDGNTADDSRWSAETQFAYITYDLGSEKDVSSVDIAWAYSTNQLTRYDIALSTDGENYQTVVMDAENKAIAGFHPNTFEAPVKARYVKIIGRTNNSGEWGQWISITEVEIKDVDGNKLEVADATASSYQDPNVPMNTLDGNTADDSRWSAETQFTYITYDLGTEKDVSSVDIAWAYSTNQLTRYDIGLSTDGENYQTVVMDAENKAIAGFQPNTFEAPVKARYVKIIGRTNNSGEWGQWISITEVKIVTQ